MKINILFELKDGPTGGGNQFLKSLKRYLKSVKAYEDEIQKADVILINSYQYIDDAAKIKLSYRDKVFLHRIDGPIRLYNKKGDRRDYVTNIANRLIADGTVFQSEWSRKQNYKLGLKKNNFEDVIGNAPDREIFNNSGRIEFSPKRKTRLIASSWSPNWNKGFKVYQWLDENLDFSRYEMTFVGNSPVKFKNIKHKSPLASVELSRELKASDILIFASAIEACSNTLLEAMCCGLPVVAVNASSNAELVVKAGDVFSSPEEIPALLDRIVKDYALYQNAITPQSIEEIGGWYLKAAERIYDQVKNNSYTPKKFGKIRFLRVMLTIYLWKFSERFPAAIKGRLVSWINRFKSYTT